MSWKVSREEGIVLFIACAIFFAIGLIVRPLTPPVGPIRSVVTIIWLAGLPVWLLAGCKIIWPSRKEDFDDPD